VSVEAGLFAPEQYATHNITQTGKLATANR